MGAIMICPNCLIAMVRTTKNKNAADVFYCKKCNHNISAMYCPHRRIRSYENPYYVKMKCRDCGETLDVKPKMSYTRLTNRAKNLENQAKQLYEAARWSKR